MHYNDTIKYRISSRIKLAKPFLYKYKSAQSAVLCVLSLVIFFTSSKSFMKPSIDRVYKGVFDCAYKTFSLCKDHMNASHHKISDYFNAYGRIETLSRENAELKIKADSYDALHSEAQQLRKLTKFHVERKLMDVVKSTRIFFHNGYEGFAVIEEANNIKPGQVVVSANGLIGKIESVGENVGKVMLITNSNMHVSAILGKAGIKAILSGGYNGNLISTLINGQTMPEKGEIVMTSGDDEVFPSGIVIGNVTRVSWDTVEITPSASIANTSIVSVVDRK